MFKFRFWWVLLRAWMSLKTPTHSRLRFWVTPFDCDINLHCNNASYLKYMDLGRWDFLVRLGMLKPLLRAKITPVATRVEIDFIKAMAPGTFFVLETHFDSITEKSVVLKQTFHVGQKVVASAKVTAKFVHGGHAIATGNVVEILPPHLRALIASDRET